MIATAKMIQRVVLYEAVGAKRLDPSLRHDLMRVLLRGGYSVSRVLAGDRLVPLGHSSLIVLGQFEGELPEKLADDNGSVQVLVRDISGMEPPAIATLVQELASETGEGTAAGWKPWFPVIDYDRCTNCMQCLSFCLFDVYGVTNDGKITVQNQTNCKTDCPACSRVCPEVAILFPKYKAGPINGDEVNADDIRREAMKVDISALLGGDIYSMLRDRSAKAKSRFSKERDDERALKERQRCLKKLQESAGMMDIPGEVLSSLPSLDQIQEKAVQAKQRAADAIELRDRQAGRNQSNAHPGS